MRLSRTRRKNLTKILMKKIFSFLMIFKNGTEKSMKMKFYNVILSLWSLSILCFCVDGRKNVKKFDNSVPNGVTAKPLKTKFPAFESCSHESVPSTSGKFSVPIFEVNLDEEPEVRWRHVIKNKKYEMAQLLSFIKNNTDRIFGQFVFKYVDKFLPKLLSSLPDKFQREMEGIASAADMDIAEIILFNIFYEFFSLCTSIVMEDSDGNMYHGRNLDFSTFLVWDQEKKNWVSTEHLRNLTVTVNFMKNKEILFSSVNFAGYVGILTGVKKNMFGLTINERFKMNGGYVGLIEWILGLHKQDWVGFLSRNVMENATDYDSALEMLEKPKLLAPVYFILSGNKSHQASVITRDRRKFDVWNFGSKCINQKGDWYLVQTNYDHWKRPPFIDDRVTPAVKCADKIGNDNSTVTLYRVLSTVPVLNHETVYTSIMNIRTGSLFTWLRKCVWPC